MKTEHPTTPPLKLVRQWKDQASYYGNTIAAIEDIATQAARWGADQELEACCDVLARWGVHGIDKLRAARRPKPPSLKEQALQALASADGADHPVVATVLTADQHSLVRRALEALPDV